MSDPSVSPPPAAVPPVPARKPHWTALAITLLVIGLMIAIPSGLCTGVFGVGAIYDMMSSSSSKGAGILMTALMVGGIPLAIGIGLVAVAFSLRKNG
jgi:hypothetical protein